MSMRSASGPDNRARYRTISDSAQMHTRVGSPALPHGHGFIAAMSENRAGNATLDARARDDDAPVLQRLTQRLERGARKLQQLVEKQHAVMREAHLARAAARCRRRPVPPTRSSDAARETAARRDTCPSTASSPATE